MASGDFTVIVCPAALRPAALRRLHVSLPSESQAALRDALDAVQPTDATAWEGLLIATSDEASLTGAAWLQLAPGNSAVVWSAPPDDPSTEPLLRAVAELIDRRKIPLAQLLVPPGDQERDAQLVGCGFQRLAELVYLFADVPSAPGGLAESELAFTPRAHEIPERLAAVIEATYAGTLDCPGLDGVRAIADTLAGYRAQGRFMPDQWYVVASEGRDIGALLLADHPGSGNWELVYMGVVPEARGRGFGEQIVRHALREAATATAERLVLAVDAANSPAIAMYRDCGFREWDRRVAYARLASGASPPGRGTG